MKRATAKVWTRAEVIETVKALKEAEYDVQKSLGKIEIYVDEGADRLNGLVFRAIKATPNTWLVRYDAALFDESLLEDEQ